MIPYFSWLVISFPYTFVERRQVESTAGRNFLLACAGGQDGGSGDSVGRGTRSPCYSSRQALFLQADKAVQTRYRSLLPLHCPRRTRGNPRSSGGSQALCRRS